MESKCLPDKAVDVPPVPIKTYQWTDLRRAREAGAYPWTHLLKPQLEGEITAEDILRETSPRRSMSRDVSRERTRSRTRSPDTDMQRILNLDSSPGSSRKIGEDGEEDGIHIPNFSKEVSLDSEDDPINDAVNKYIETQPKESSEQLLAPPVASATEAPKNISPKSILKRRVPIQPITKISETRENSKCCHPLVNKIKHIADKTLHKHDKAESNKSPNAKRKKQKEQPIVQLKSSPGAVRRQKFGAIKLGDSDEMSRTLCSDVSPPTRKRKEHIYEDIDQIEAAESEKNIQFSPAALEALARPLPEDSNINKENESLSEKKSNASQDPSLDEEEEEEHNLRPDEHIMESLHKHADIEKEALVLEVDSEEPDIEDVIQNQLEECFGPQDSPNITITEITDEDVESKNLTPLLKEPEEEAVVAESPDAKTIDTTQITNDWSKSKSDHEYEIIGKPPPDIVFTTSSMEAKPTKAEDELSSTTSLERKYLQHTLDDEDQIDDKAAFDDLNGDEILAAEALQKDLEDRYFVSTPSTVSRTECDVSTSQVDSSALENLPLKRDSRANVDIADSKLQQKFKEQTGKLKNQANKLKTKLQSIKSKQFSLPDKTKFKLPQMPERPKFTMPERRKFSLPERPKFKKINISEKLSLGDRKKFSFPDRPKFTMPDLPKFKIPEKAKINFSSLGRKKDYRMEPDSAGSSEDLKNIATVEFESRTYPRLFNRKKTIEPLASSSPTLNRADTPPPVFSFAKVTRDTATTRPYKSDNVEEPREYGNLPQSSSFHGERIEDHVPYDTEYDFDKLEREYDEENRRFHEAIKAKASNDENTSSLPDVSSSKPECTNVINEINNDEFFVRPKGISRENIEVTQYLSDEIREAFKMPSNSLALMGSDVEVDNNHGDIEGEDADPELYLDDEPEKSITEDLIDRDDGYYTFPPVRPSRAKKMKKKLESVEYIDQSINASMQFSDVDIEGNNELETVEYNENIMDNPQQQPIESELNLQEFESKTLPMPPKRKKKSLKSDSIASLNDLRRPNVSYTQLWNDQNEDANDIIVYRTEHEYTVPETSNAVTEQSPLPPRRSRNRSRSSHGTSLGDDDRTSHGAESLTLDPNLSTVEQGIEFYRKDRQESPGYATVEKYPPVNVRRSKSKTPPARRRKSHSSDRKYYTVDRIPSETSLPDRPPRKKSSTSLITLESLKRGVSAGDVTQYVEIDELNIEDARQDLKSGEIISKMKDRPLPPPPRPPRGPKKSKLAENCMTDEIKSSEVLMSPTQTDIYYPQGDGNIGEEVVEIEVSTQTDPLPDDIDYELGMDEHFDVSMSSSLHDIVEDEIILSKSQIRLTESPRGSRPTSRSDKSLIPTDPKIQELSKTTLGRTSPTVILVERRVSSPTRINEREEIVTEASLTVQPIEVDETIIPEVPPLPRADVKRPPRHSERQSSNTKEERALEKVGDIEHIITDVQLDNLVTQRLQVRDLDVGRLNVSELQASKILVSEIEGMTLQVTELDSKSGHISVSGIELSPSVIDEIVKKFAELATTNIIPAQSSPVTETPRPISREEHTQTEEQASAVPSHETVEKVHSAEHGESAMATSPPTQTPTEPIVPPVRPPPPDLTPLLYSYLQDLSIPPASFYQLRTPRERPFSEFFEAQGSSAAPPPPTRRVKRKPVHHSGSSSDEDARKPSPRRMPPSSRVHEPSVTEAGVQFFRVCQNSISRTLRSMFNTLMSYVSGTEDKKDVQMALVIFLVLIAGLIMFGLSDGRTVHHHHWEFFNPPDGNSK